jgi:hypothetical protein
MTLRQKQYLKVRTTALMHRDYSTPENVPEEFYRIFQTFYTFNVY